MKSTRKQSSSFLIDSGILFIIGLAFFSLAFFIGDIVVKKVLSVGIKDVVPNIMLFILAGAYLFASIMFGVELVESFLKKQSKGLRIFFWVIFPITYIFAIIIGIIFFIPALLYMLIYTLFIAN